jgi:hypothetical protein
LFKTEALVINYSSARYKSLDFSVFSKKKITGEFGGEEMKLVSSPNTPVLT